jgi:aldehyde:ferredoxin oxidoreductase
MRREGWLHVRSWGGNGFQETKAVVLDGKKRVRVYNRSEVTRLSKICNKWVQFQIPLGREHEGYLGALLRLLPTAMAMDGMIYKAILRQWGTAV